MSLLAHNFYSPDVSFTPLFRLLDDFDSYSRGVQGTQSGRRGTQAAARTFSPKFDVRETESTYELHGELPGVERENLNIEFTDPQTIVIHGHVERTYSSGTPPAGLVEASPESEGKAAVTESGDNAKVKGGADADAAATEKSQQRAEKFWVSERSVGDFTRSFAFPGPVDHDAVAAGLNDGILTVTVPKARKRETRRIAVH